MTGFKLLFKNNFKNTVKNKIQFFGLVVLVFLTSFIFTIIEVSKQRVDNNYNTFISEQLSNQHDFVVSFTNTTYVKNSNGEPDQFEKITDSGVRQNAILEFINEQLKNRNEHFIYNRVEARTFSLGNNKVIKAVTLNPYQEIDKFIVANGMPLSFYMKYLLSINEETMHWIYLTPEFASKNNIKINDIIRLQPDRYGTTIKVADSELKGVDLTSYEREDINKWLPKSPYSNENWFRVVGFGQSADYVTPIIDAGHPFPNMKNEGIAYLDPRLFGLVEDTVEDTAGNKYPVTKLDLTKQILIPESQLEQEIYYVGKFQQTKVDQMRSNYSQTINNYLNTDQGKHIGLNGYYVKTLSTGLPIATFRTDNRYEFAKRITYFTSTLSAFISGSYILITILLIISFFVLILVIRRQIDATGPQNGLLRALGYRRRLLTFSYISYPLMIALIVEIVGYVTGISGQFTVKYLFGSYFNLPYGNFVFAPLALVTCVLFIFALLTCVTMVSGTIMMVSRTPLQLIRKEKTVSHGRFKKIVYKIFAIRKTFDARFQAVQLSNSIGKMVGVSLTMIISTIMITMSTTIPIILQNNIRYSYEGDNYKTLVEYNSPIYNLPTSFLRTYDPSQKPWDSKNSLLTSTNMTTDVNQYLTDFETGQINSENFAPTYQADDMRLLLYRNISKEFLQSNKLISSDPGLYKAICSTTWGDYNDFALNLLTKSTIEQYLRTTETAREHIDILEKSRLFYWKYRETVGLKIKRADYFDLRGNLNLNDKLINNIFTQSDYKRDFGEGNPTITLANNHFRPALEQPLSVSFYDVLNSATGNEFNTRLKKPMYDLYNWIYAYFVENVNQCFIQGVYSRSPQTVRLKMQEAFNQNNGNFNLTFGVIPFNPLTDDRGTMINAELNSIEFKIYGINRTFKNQALTNKNGANLNEKLFTASNNIVLNESLAKSLNVTVGNQITPYLIRKALVDSNQGVTSDQILQGWDGSYVTGDDAQAQGRVGKLMFNGDNKYKNKVIDENNEYVLESKIDAIDPNFTKPSILNDKIVDGSYRISNQMNNQTFTVVGITNQYGSPRAWINEDRAQQLLGYDKTRNYLLQLFLNEWMNSFIRKNPELTPSRKESLNLLEKFIKDHSSTHVNNLWNKFVEYWSVHQSAVNWIAVFENEYPIFNYKISNSAKIDDIETGLGTSQLFGDYSFYGLNGGIRSKISYPPYANSTFGSLMPIASAQAILGNISKAVNGIIFFIIGISFVLSFMIIILTSNIVIAENQTIIATMKVLGYRNRYITKLVIGMYIPIIVIMTIAGFGFGWLFLIIFNMILIRIGIVLPLFMNVTIPFIAIGSGLLLYFIAYLISWFNMNRINPLIAIMNAD
ncbi:ABC transporter permease [Spiroplasma endosymbiont of Megaselia nigra]|uniref:ABC transporter permease n=1 Tax=Spiroplasma endosymbiont of Megaselia nigra TaxID=2478537 RepID=UPI000F861B00|nr:ABC transporter permease [Spiroplasma endosymbiont of Megaselia nigra]RUO86530.1 ABC transporter permease [Spiroplasma endosymbiont of Megaselia nigra]